MALLKDGYYVVERLNLSSRVAVILIAEQIVVLTDRVANFVSMTWSTVAEKGNCGEQVRPSTGNHERS